MRKQIVCALAVLTVALMAHTAYIVHAQSATAAELRTRLATRYDIVALQQGIALVPKAANSQVRMVQVVNGAVTVDGATLTAAQLRERLGADAAPIIQLTYLSAAEQRELVSPETPAIAPPASTSMPTPAPSETPAPALAGTPLRSAERGSIMRFGGPVTVAQNERIQGDVVAFGGSVDVEGEVTGLVMTVGGPLTLGPHAVVRGEVTTVGGPLIRDAGAQVYGKVQEVGGGLGTTTPGVRARSISRTIFGSFASRVGSFAATIARVLMFVLFALIVTAVGGRPVQQIAARIAAEPVRAGLVGLLAEILFVPVICVTIVALVISIIGIPLLILVPFGIILIGVVMLVGFTGSAYIAGGWVLERLGRTERSPYLVVVSGIVVIAGLTLLGKLFSLALGVFGAPISFVGYLIEYFAWTVGFGAAILAWLKWRQQRSTPPFSTPMPESA